ncbi:MAG: peptide-methionine (S)-S-oxide reductase MsrA, partial [Nitrosopumilaceae archaeon]|nr:peptide-methionine (S)-S-oxide reductase MsrA [Nitrosopumilaceae archaeon]NIU85903.1 peptide-methionine (S)-S-oxide reductase MsrA [Nitrosopumilaceae archaeon]NIV64737.1 peptide-methionine (S)-S-oxide reductase MsrA [Nitrosopumilaceae archaeon]NIX60134.1 peptide-methionine (S)-S-oxide reductase MsrA [Nitrosopumilaceae archaeon]
VEALFRQVKGVTNTCVGYTGGKKENPTYEDVCSDRTGHAEAVQVEYDPNEVSYDELLKVFWNNHDPTSLDRQGPDIGTQYRSVIFYHDEEQQKKATKSRDELTELGEFDKEIVTQIIPASTFYKAEEYHQRYFDKRGIE